MGEQVLSMLQPFDRLSLDGLSDKGGHVGPVAGDGGARQAVASRNVPHRCTGDETTLNSVPIGMAANGTFAGHSGSASRMSGMGRQGAAMRVKVLQTAQREDADAPESGVIGHADY